MIEGSFDSRTLTTMNIALNRVCTDAPDGENHVVRKRVATEIVRCAESGHTALDDLIAAGLRGLTRAPVARRR
jgi:hypothetical protein